LSFEIVPLEASHRSLVLAFNQRLRAGNAGFQFPEKPNDLGLPKAPGKNVYHDVYLAILDGTVRGGYALKTQPCSIAGKIRNIGNYQLPLSEGVIDPRFAIVGLKIYSDAIKRQPSLYSLGMGGITRPLPRMLAKMGWFVELVPFYFRILRAQSFFKNIVFLRNKRSVRLPLDTLRFTGLGWLGVLVARHLSAAPRTLGLLSGGTRYEVVSDFGPWADSIWKQASPTYALINVRDQAVLRILYPSEEKKFIRLRVSGTEGPIGWALVMKTQLKNHKQFGNMMLGSIVDVLALPGRETAVTAHATSHLEESGVDLIVSNQSHSSWKRALLASGFVSAPSNFGFACSPSLANEFASLNRCHLNRGDGDGPINL
jgi:hypothetical protein